jgi:hypothetical protein
MKHTTVRQGDVLVRACETIPGSAMPVAAEKKRLILARGEATGHNHSVALSERVAMFRDDGTGGALYIEVKGVDPVMLTHQEHHSLPIAPGRHEVRIQRTYQAAMARRVQD